MAEPDPPAPVPSPPAVDLAPAPAEAGAAPGDPAEAPGAPAGAAPPAKPRLRDPVWDPPTILYTPKGEDPTAPPAGRAPARPARTALDAARREPDDVTSRASPRAAAEPDDLTVRMPERSRRAEDEDPTIKAPERAPRARHDSGAPEDDDDDEDEAPPKGVKGHVRWFLKHHGKKIWWLHTGYALGLGAFVVTFANKGFAHARWLAVSLGVAWLVVILFFRLFGTGARQDFATAWRGARLRFLVMTYVLKNLYQGMLFFLLPFYWKSATLDAPNRWFVLALAACAVLATLDLVFDRVLMRWKILASMFYGMTLFACLNLVIPALFPNTRTLWTLLSAAGVAVLAFSTMHLPLAALRRRAAPALLLGAVGAGVGLAYATREMIPPVPMHLSSAAVGPTVLADGRLAMEVRSLHTSVIRELIAVTDVVVPGGKGDRLHHVWRHGGKEVYRAPEEMSRVAGPEGAVRLQSQLAAKRLPATLTGHWTVDVETEDGQLVGRTSFEVTQ